MDVAQNLPYLHQGEVAEGVSQGAEYNYREEWGEQMVGKSQPLIVRLGLDTDQPADVKVMAEICRRQCCGSESERIRKFWLDPNPKKSSDSDTDPDTVVE
jgi:hypothetical protein